MVTNTTATTELVETGEKRDTLGRRHTPAERRAELLAAYRASGLTQSEVVSVASGAPLTGS